MRSILFSCHSSDTLGGIYYDHRIVKLSIDGRIFPIVVKRDDEMKQHILTFENVESRCLLAASPFDLSSNINACFAEDYVAKDYVAKDYVADREQAELNREEVANAQAVDTEPQYRINQTPRLQIGNAPLAGTPAYDGKDQVEILWQTIPAGNGTEDSFVAQIRDANSTLGWRNAETYHKIDTKAQGRIVHSATFTRLEWNQRYEYRVQHLRSGEVVDEYEAGFKTRLESGDPTPFTFAAYGDSAVPGEPLENFRSVQKAINDSDSAFSVLLGDNIYDSGTHQEADARFNPELNPEATEWIASHIDYFAIGNHELFGAGTASLDSFSMPIPKAGVNAFAEPAESDIPEFFGSFDYGNVHFVTFDSNSAELGKGTDRVAIMERQADFLFANLEASTAKWKVVYMHHPMVGSAKLTLYPNTDYLEILMPRLIDAGVDLVLTGDSHTYAWTYPISGLDDADNDGEIADTEIVFNETSRHEFDKGTGVVQLISGAGGRKLRTDRFGQPVMAQSHSLDGSTLPLHFGHAEISVSNQVMEVRYISAETGQIMGDLNANGMRDDGEDYFSVFRIVDEGPAPNGDVNDDGSLDIHDLDAICSAILGSETDSRFDMNNDGSVNLEDHQYHLSNILGATVGDANLDGIVNSSDLVAVFRAGRYEKTDGPRATWAEGDWNCDGRFTTRDLVLLFEQNVYDPA
ncbi:metallophosphoesterase [Planctomycetota bacterium]